MKFEVPVTEPKITKELLLTYNSEETYMSTYLGIPVKKGLLISPLRNDKRPTASFYRNKKGVLIFHDFGIGFHGDFVSVVRQMYNISYYQALIKIAKDFGIIKSDKEPSIKIRKTDIKIEEKPTTVIQVEIKPFTENELQWWESFGVTENTLKKFKVYSCKSLFLNHNYLKSSSAKSFMFGYYGGKRDENELWRIYFPQNREFRFLSNWSKHIIQGIKHLPVSNDNLVIEKSLKDVMCLYEQGIHSIAPCSENTLLSEAQLRKFKDRFKNLYTFMDNDLAGVRAANKYKKMIPEIKCIFIKRKYAKDISDFYKFQGKRKFSEAIEELNTIFKDKSIKQTKYFYVF